MFNKSIEPPQWKADKEVREGERTSEPEIASAIRLEHLADAIQRPIVIEHGANLLSSLPAELVRVARDSLGARGIIFALLSAPKTLLESSIAGEVERLRASVDALDIHAKLPLIELTFPALRTLSFDEYKAFVNKLQSIINSDHQVDLFEFALQKMVSRHLAPHFEGVPKRTIRYLRINPLAPHCSVLLSSLAHAGQDTPQQAEAAFRQGCTTLAIPADDMQFLPVSECGLSRINEALDELAQAAEGIRNLILNAAVHVISADGVLRIEEAELLRAIGDSLGCPIPPLNIPMRSKRAAA